MTKTWVVRKVHEEALADTLNDLEQKHFELLGIYPTADAGTFLLVGVRVVKQARIR